MTGGLPRGLISIATATAADVAEQPLEQDDDVITRTQHIGKSWKIYAASSTVLGQDAGERLENLFWRLWSSPRLVRVTDAETITSWAISISQGHGRLTLPRPSGRDDDATPTPSSPETTIAGPARTSPTISPNSPVSTGAAVDHIGPVAHHIRGESSGSATETVSPSSNRPSLKSRTSSGSKKRTTFVAATGPRTKTRPLIGRKRSSQSGQSSAAQSSEQVRSPVPPMPTMHTDRPVEATHYERPTTLAPPPGLPVPSTAGKTSMFMLPSASSWQSVESSTSPHTSTTSLSSQAPSLLVDRDFRGKFVEQQKRAASQTNLVAAAQRLKKSGSIVRFADEQPEDVQQRRKGSLRSYSDEQAASATGHRVVHDDHDTDEEEDGEDDNDGDDDGDEDDDAGEDRENDGPILPRVRSQLSMLIEHQRQTGTLNLDHPTPDQSKGKGKGKATEADMAKEDELLQMGRKDGVTKAGGVTRSRAVQTPASPSHTRYPSPPPPALF